MSVHEFGLGDVAECPHCGKEFEMNNLDEDELNDFDNYFEHVTTCDGFQNPLEEFVLAIAYELKIDVFVRWLAKHLDKSTNFYHKTKERLKWKI